jgi:uncharacterized protein involved in response to NO
MSRKEANWTGWTLYYSGRALQLFGLFLVTRAVFMSSGSQMRAMLALTGAGAAFFVVGWLLARNDPEGRS